MRWLVGDVQGCVREFERLLHEIRFDDHRDELWILGDLINRGPHSLETLRLWVDIGGRGLIGNHDVYALLAHSGRLERKRDTLDALFAAPDRDELFARLRKLPALASLPSGGDGPDAWIVHAGVHPGWLDLEQVRERTEAGPHDDDWLQSDDIAFATRARCCTKKGKMVRHTGAPEDCPGKSRPWDDRYTGDGFIVHGHWARRGHYRGPHSMGLDSGCVYGGPLTAWCQEEDRIVQVPALDA